MKTDNIEPSSPKSIITKPDLEKLDTKAFGRVARTMLGIKQLPGEEDDSSPPCYRESGI